MKGNFHAWFGGGRLEKGLRDKYLTGLLPSGNGPEGPRWAPIPLDIYIFHELL